MGFRKPTLIQGACIPEILKGRDVVGCAETGSGKTAAFAIPILERIGQEPWGIAALILTPSRELAFQIAEQFSAFGSALKLRVSVVTGGVDFVAQGSALAAVPHVVVATPGRMAFIIRQGGTPPDLSRLAFLVLDEVDTLCDESFSLDLRVVLESAGNSGVGRQNLLFSATLASIPKVPGLTLSDSVFLYNVGEPHGSQPRDSSLSNHAASFPSSLLQEYLFVPSAVKNSYLVHLLLRMGPLDLVAVGKDANVSSRKRGVNQRGVGKDTRLYSVTGREGASVKTLPEETFPRARSLIIFASTCSTAACLAELCKELGIPCTALHSVMPQTQRMGALAKFKGSLVRVLVATDVASRGLDLPAVDLVINYDVPRVPVDYVHRVGRTARAGRGGRAVTIVTQYEIALLQAIESGALGGKKLEKLPDYLYPEQEVLGRLTKIALALELAKGKLVDIGFTDQLETAKRRKRESREERKRGRTELIAAQEN